MVRGLIRHLVGFACGILAASCVFAQVAPPVTIRFDIQRYEVVGNTLIKAEEVEKLVAPFTGKQRDFGDAQLALEALERAYRAAGYSAVQVYLPEQEVARGVITLKVIETRVGVIKIEGNKFFDETNVRRSLPALQEGTTPNANKISANVRVANENPAKQANVVLRVSPKEGDVDVGVEMTDENPRKVFVTLDNTGNPQTGSYRLGVGFQNANLFNRDHVMTLQYITSPEKPDQVSIYSFGYRIPLYALGDTLDFFAGISDVDAGTTNTAFGPLLFSGKGKVAGARYNQFLRRRGEYEHKITYGFDYRIYDNTCAFGVFGAAGCGAGGADITVHPLSVAYSGQWTQPTSQRGFYVALAHNIPGGSKGKDADFATAVGRTGADANYQLLRLGGNWVNAFANNWQTRIVLNGQYTNDPLVPGEQFGLGGASSVRGFREREIANDKGYSANLELYTPDFGPKLGIAGASARALVFYDFGTATRVNPLPAEVARSSVASIGAGLRFNLKKSVALRLDIARVVNEGGNQSNGDHRGHFGLVLSF